MNNTPTHTTSNHIELQKYKRQLHLTDSTYASCVNALIRIGIEHPNTLTKIRVEKIIRNIHVLARSDITHLLQKVEKVWGKEHITNMHVNTVLTSLRNQL